MLRRGILILLVLAGCEGSEGNASRFGYWAQTAVDDLHFVRATLRVNHPGPADEQNPWFGEWFEEGFDQALALAELAQDYAGYFFAIQRYTVGFQDGHLGALGDDRLANDRLQRRWPGFLLGYSGDEFVVVETAEPDSAGPRRGARLVECDGRAPSQWAEEILQTYVGLWSVRGARARLAPFLFIDEGNPWVAMPTACTFAHGAETTSHELAWRPIGSAELRKRIEAARPTVRPPIGLQRFGEGRYWISLSSFDASDDVVVAAIETTVAELARELTALRTARVLVFDVRGNHGGNSRYGEMVAEAVWGESFIRALPPRATAVDWRVSGGNYRFLRDFNLARTERRFGSDAPETLSYTEFVDRFREALERGQRFLTRSVERSPSPETAPVDPVSARVFLLTDDQCFSACLDFADILRAIDGVTHVGQETSADAIYIDNRAVELPSQLGRLGFSMKVYRGRIRGHNESYVPHEPWTGDITDTPALQRWIARLAEEEG